MNEIRLSPKFLKEFSCLKRKALKGDGEAEYILDLIRKGISTLSKDIESGQKIQKRLWPKYYSRKYGISNLWRLRLDRYWRMIYTLIGEEIRIITVILEVIDHKDYNRRFGYK